MGLITVNLDNFERSIVFLCLNKTEGRNDTLGFHQEVKLTAMPKELHCDGQ